jgi:predicted nucleotidyltransferase component of viral defense system
MKIKNHISKRAFWDSDFNELDFSENSRFIITRVFDYGKWQDIIRIIEIYGDEKIIKTLTQAEHLSEFAVQLASSIFNINKKSFGYSTNKQYHPSRMPGQVANCELKIDFMSNEQFIRPYILEEGIHIAHIEDIAAMKLEAITSRLEKKDFWDISELLERYSLKQLTGFYKERYPWNDLREVMERITQFHKCEENSKSSEVLCINGKTWNDVKQIITNAFNLFVLDERKSAWQIKPTIDKDIDIG